MTLPRFRSTNLAVTTKPDLTPVTDADRAAEEAMRRRLDEARPDDAVLGEELGDSGPGARRRWVLDPLDGTMNYVRGVPVWASLIALERDGVADVGVVSAPALGRRWWAARGAGAYADGVAMHVSGVSVLADAHLSYPSILEFERFGLVDAVLDVERRCWRARGYGDFWSHVLVAEGGFDVAFEPEVERWDVAPVWVIVEEAGGRFTDLRGRRRSDGGSAISTNGVLHDEVLALLGTSAGPR